MERHHYFVVRGEEGWIVQTDGENSEIFGSRFDAVRGAIGLAELDHLQGSRAQVIAQGEDGVFRAAWTSEFDAAPPRARIKMPSKSVSKTVSKNASNSPSKTRRGGHHRVAA